MSGLKALKPAKKGTRDLLAGASLLCVRYDEGNRESLKTVERERELQGRVKSARGWWDPVNGRKVVVTWPD